MVVNSRRPIREIGNDPSRIPEVPILECGEPIVEVVEEPHIFVGPTYHARGIASAPDRIAVRLGVLERLRRAASALPAGMALFLWDGLRTLETQMEIVEDFRVRLPEEGREETIKRYLAPPPESEYAFRASPPPHTTGGAIDLTLCDSAGRPLEMGADFDEFDETAWLAYFEGGQRAADTGSSASAYRDRRRTLYWAMVDAGFAPYPWEFWHYEFGTAVAAVFHGLSFARYGASVRWVPAR